MIKICVGKLYHRTCLVILYVLIINEQHKYSQIFKIRHGVVLE